MLTLNNDPITGHVAAAAAACVAVAMLVALCCRRCRANEAIENRVVGSRFGGDASGEPRRRRRGEAVSTSTDIELRTGRGRQSPRVVRRQGLVKVLLVMVTLWGAIAAVLVTMTVMGGPSGPAHGLADPKSLVSPGHRPAGPGPPLGGLPVQSAVGSPSSGGRGDPPEPGYGTSMGVNDGVVNGVQPPHPPSDPPDPGQGNMDGTDGGSNPNPGDPQPPASSTPPPFSPPNSNSTNTTRHVTGASWDDACAAAREQLFHVRGQHGHSNRASAACAARRELETTSNIYQAAAASTRVSSTRT